MTMFLWNKFRLLHSENLTRHWPSHFGLRRKATFPLMRATLFWVITQPVVIISYGRFGTTYPSHPRGSRIQTKVLSLHWLPHFLPSQPLASTLLADTTLLRLFISHTLPYINPVLGQKAFFWILEPWRWDQWVVLNTGKKLPLLAAQ